MPPKMIKRKAIKKMVKKRIAEAIEEYEKSRANPSMLAALIEKVEQVLEICKCVEEDKVMFAASTFEGHALTWWNRNDVTCYGCGEKGNYKDKFPKGRNHQDEGACARAYVMGTENPQHNLNVVTGTFLVNDHYASILFDSGDEKSFVSIEFTPFINIATAILDTSYEVELVDGKVVRTNTVLHGCTLALFNNVFKIDLLPTRLGSFDVIVGMDWLSYHRVVIVCYEKIFRIPLLNGEILKIQGERPKKDSKSLSCIKADEKNLDDIRIIRDFPKVFTDDLTCLPPVREIKFRTDLIPDALSVVKSP
nr:hypothetical protein [Tanacetum cinerariifolium]